MPKFSTPRDEKRRPAERWPRIVILIAKNTAIGALVGLAFAAGLIAWNAGGLLDLLGGAGDPLTPVLLMAASFASLFGSVFAGIAVMFLHRSD